MVHHVLSVKFEWPFVLQAQILVEKNIPGFVYGVTNLDEEIYFNGGGPNVVGDPLSGEVGPESIMWICSQTKLITSSFASFPETDSSDLVTGSWLH